MMTNIDEMRMDKTIFEIADMDEFSNEQRYWHSISPLDRLAALELLRQVMYGYDPITTRLQRILTIDEHP